MSFINMAAKGFEYRISEWVVGNGECFCIDVMQGDQQLEIARMPIRKGQGVWKITKYMNKECERTLEGEGAIQ